MEHAVGRAGPVSWRWRDGRSVGFGLLLGVLEAMVVVMMVVMVEVVVVVMVVVMVEVMVEVDVADGWLSPGLALYLDFLPPDAEEDESRGEDDEETGGGETEGEQTPAGGQSGRERNHSQSALLTEVSLAGPAGDIAPVLRSGPHCHSLREGHQVGPQV